MPMLREMAASSGVTPPALLNRPSLSYLLSWAMEHFNTLTNDRAYGADMPLKLSTFDIEFYRRAFDVDFDRDDFHRYIRIIDDAWYGQMLDRRKKAMTT